MGGWEKSKAVKLTASSGAVEHTSPPYSVSSEASKRIRETASSDQKVRFSLAYLLRVLMVSYIKELLVPANQAY